MKALIIGILGVSAAAVLGCWQVHVSAPPPPPAAGAKAPATVTYDHTLKKVDRTRKPVIALLRGGDLVALKDYLPFGRTLVANRIEANGSKTPVLVQGGADADIRLPADIRPFLVREMLDTREFVVIERERILEIARELALAKTGAANPATTARPGMLIGVHYIVEAAYWPVGGLPPDDPALDGVKREIARRRLRINPSQACVMYLTVYKVETGEVKAVACGADLRPMVAVKKAVEDLVDQMADVVEPIKVTAVDPRTGLATFDMGADSGVKANDMFTVVPPAGADKSAAPIKVQVTEVAPLYSLARILSADKTSVRTGQELAPETMAQTK